MGSPIDRNRNDRAGPLNTIEELNKEYAAKVLELFGNNKSKAAEVRGISRTSLWRILKEE